MPGLVKGFSAEQVGNASLHCSLLNTIVVCG